MTAGVASPAPPRKWGDVDPAKKPFRLKPATKEFILTVKDAPQDAPAYGVRESEAFKEAVKHELVYVDETRKSADGLSVAVILSPAGVAKAATYLPAEGAVVRGPLPNPDDFTIDDDVPVPDFSRGPASRPSYPFDRLNVGQSFFIPPTESTSNPAKSKQSTITSYNRKMRDEFAEAKAAVIAAGGTPDETAKPKLFKIKEDVRDGVTGARVWRVE